jgi:hypothetical protein
LRQKLCQNVPNPIIGKKIAYFCRPETKEFISPEKPIKKVQAEKYNA